MQHLGDINNNHKFFFIIINYITANAFESSLHKVWLWEFLEHAINTRILWFSIVLELHFNSVIISQMRNYKKNLAF